MPSDIKAESGFVIVNEIEVLKYPLLIFVYFLIECFHHLIVYANLSKPADDFQYELLW